MKRTLYRRNSFLNRFVSLWVAFAFVMSLTSVAVAETPEAVVTPPVEQTITEPVPAEVPAPSESVASESAEPVEAAPAEATPAEPPTGVKLSKSSVPKSVEAAPVTMQVQAAEVEAATIGILSHVAPVLVAGNPSLGSGGFRIDSGELPDTGETKTYVRTVGSITVTVTVSVYDDGMGQLFDWTSTWPITSVVAKGGPNANVYTYDPTVTSDTGLHSPINLDNNKYPDLSHIDFYLMSPAEITAYKFNDLDRDGVRDAGEPYLSGWALQLKSGSTVVKSGTTDADGKVVFTGVAPAAYTVHETLQDGWVVTSDPYPVPVTVSSGQKKTVEIGNAQVSDLTVLKYRDLDADGVRDDGEPALSGWTIQLLKDDEVIASSVTGSDGQVVFTGLVPGSYEVTEVLAGGWFATHLLPIDVTVVAGQDQSVSIGNAEYPDLSVLKFLDVDRDGVRDEGEPALAGWTFHLMVEGSVVYSAVTNESGIALFSNVDPGAYDLHEVVSDPWFATAPLPVVITMAANVDQSVAVGNSLTVTKTFELTYPALPDGASVWVEYAIDDDEPVLEQLVSQGDDVYAFDVDVFYNTTISGRWVLSLGEELFTLGEFGPEVLTSDLTNVFEYESIIGGVKYGDDDADGVRDEGEVGLAGWTINLYRVVEDTPVFYGSTVTGEGGAYAFVGLPPGSYTVEEVQQTGWTQTDAPEGAVTISGENQQALGLDFGNTQFAPFEPEPNTAIEKTADVTTADPGDVITYTLTYRNTGDTDIDVLTITDDYDERYLTPVDVGDGVVENGRIAWERFDLLVGETRTITYTMRVDEDMPEGTTVVDNTAVIDPFGDSDTWRVTVENPALPFTEDEEDFLPFTGSDWALLGIALVLTLAAGLLFRRKADTF